MTAVPSLNAVVFSLNERHVPRVHSILSNSVRASCLTNVFTAESISLKSLQTVFKSLHETNFVELRIV